MNGCKTYGQVCCAIVLLSTVIVTVIGCGTDRPKTVPVTGRVTIDGQPPGENGNIYFSPTAVADGYSKRPASAVFIADGTYRVMSWEPDDGLVPGSYAVSVMPGNPDSKAIPERYRQNSSSGLTIDVPVNNRKIQYDIELVTN